MTYVEFFDKASIENVCACLTVPPEKVIFIGNSKKRMEKYITRYNNFFTKRGTHIDFSYKTVDVNNIESIIAALSEIVEQNNDCMFDLTGGDDLVLVAMGIVKERYKDKAVLMQRFNISSGSIKDCDMDGKAFLTEFPKITVEENIQIYGGDACTNTDESMREWFKSATFPKEIAELWECCRMRNDYWNMQTKFFDACEQHRIENEDPLCTIASIESVADAMKRRSISSSYNNAIVKNLKIYGLIRTLSVDNRNIKIVYKNENIRKCLTKAGLVLELIVYSTALSLCNQGVYNDAMQGVSIDWIGESSGMFNENEQYSSENEVDVVIMRGLTPIFVSCKNGMVTVDELYKLNTVADRFGEKYARKVIIANSLYRDSIDPNYFRKRAEDMGIRLIDDLCNYDSNALLKIISKIHAV